MVPDAPLLSAFVTASLVLAAMPGPGVLFIVARSVAQGRRAGLLSVAGVAVGNLGNAIAAAAGLAAVLTVSAAAFGFVKWLGALYLVWLGARMLLRGASASSARPADAPATRLFLDGFVVALFNPKTTIFFAAYLPQFLAPGAPLIPQILALGALFVAIAAVTDSVYALTAGRLYPLLRASPRRMGQRLVGGFFIGLGLWTAMAGVRVEE